MSFFTIPCIDPIFGPTQIPGYWSSSANVFAAEFAWEVYFNTGEAVSGLKPANLYARAVRSAR